MSRSKSKRVLVLISFLSPKKKLNFYNFVETAGIKTAKLFLKSKYRDIIVLRDSEATERNFVATLKKLGAERNVHTIDCFVQLHGQKSFLYFYDKTQSDKDVGVKMTDLARSIGRLNLKNKLRLCYSTACYAAYHNDDFLRAGFKTSIGAKKVNANAATEMPVFCRLWAKGNKLSTVLFWAEKGHNVSDILARAAGETNVDSNKDLDGKGGVRISSSAK